MKEYVIIKMETAEAEEMEKWIKNSKILAEKLNSPKETIEKFEKFEKIVKKREPATK